MTKKLTRDAERMEQIAIETANYRDRRYLYAIAVAVLHVLEWINRKEARYENDQKL